LYTLGSLGGSSNRYVPNRLCDWVRLDVPGMSFPTVPNLATLWVRKLEETPGLQLGIRGAYAFYRRSFTDDSGQLSFVLGSPLSYPWQLGLILA